MKRFLFFIFIFIQFYSLQAQTINVQSPKIVAVGETFSIKFILSGSEVKEFSAPSLSDFRLVAGPVQAYRKIEDGISGKKAEEHTVSFHVIANTEGKFTIGQSEAEIDGKIVKSNSFTVEVIKSDGALKPKNQQQPSNTGTTSISNNDLYIRLELNRSTLYRGESLIASVKIYSRVDGFGIQGFKPPVFTGFFSQEIEVPANEASLQRENVNDKIYKTAVYQRYVLTPQQTGRITFDPTEMSIAVSVPRKNQPANMFEAIFDSPYETITKKVVSPSVSVTVKNLPSGAPSSFKGAVGNFKLESLIDKTQSQANQALSSSIIISGTGNLKLIEQPVIVYPPDFDKYDAKVVENIKTTASGGSGSKKWETAIIPRSAGNFSIPSVEFTYFDPSKESYITLRSKDISLLIDRDLSGGGTASTTVSIPGVNSQNIRHLGKDVIFIKTTPLVLQAKGLFFIGSISYYLLFLGLLLLSSVFYFILKKQANDSKNTALMRNRKANKIAYKRLKLSAKLLKQDNMNGFYDELLRAMWGYTSDKLNIPLANLSRDNAQETMLSRNLDQSDIDTFLNVIDECEFARYAPGDEGRNKMEHIYNDAISVISKFEQTIR